MSAPASAAPSCSTVYRVTRAGVSQMAHIPLLARARRLATAFARRHSPLRPYPRRPMNRLTVLSLALTVTALGAACTTEPDPSCNQIIGQTHVVVDSAQSVGLQIPVTDSVQLLADVRVVESARPDAFVGGGTICRATFGDPVNSPVTLATPDSGIIAVRHGNWLVAKALGNITIAATAPAADEPAFVNVIVTP